MTAIRIFRDIDLCERGGRITSVTYKQKFPTFQFLNCDIGFEASIEPGESELTVLGNLKKIAETFHQQEFPHLYTESGKPITFEQVKEEEPVDKRIAVIIQDIMDCQVIDEVNGLGVQVGLLGFEKMAAGHPELKAAYDLRLKQLQK